MINKYENINDLVLQLQLEVNEILSEQNCTSINPMTYKNK